MPVRFEIEARQDGVIYAYMIVFDFPEELTAGGKPFYVRAIVEEKSLLMFRQGLARRLIAAALGGGS